MSSTSPKATQILGAIQKAGLLYQDQKPGSREQLLDLSHALIASLELPSEAIQRTGWAEPARNAHCRVAVELKIFEHLAEAGDNGLELKDLAAKAGADETLIARIVKHLAAMRVVGEKDTEGYIATPLTKAFAEPKYRDGLIYTYDVAGPSFRALPEYLKTTKYANPTELTDGPFQYAHKTRVPFFAWLDQNPPYLPVFNNYMSAYRAGKPSWADPGFYPINERLVHGFDSKTSETLLVDVGGGLGHDLTELRAKHPSLPGKLILQDRSEVIAGLAPSTKHDFEAASHDFFTPQPVKHARAYHLHSVLHDWSDDDSVRILEQLKPAMKKGYSRLLINEIMVPDRGASWPITAMDQLMLVLGAMRERTETQWTSVLNRAGFEIVRIYSFQLGAESLIEAELA